MHPALMNSVYHYAEIKNPKLPTYRYIQLQSMELHTKPKYYYILCTVYTQKMRKKKFEKYHCYTMCGNL